MNLVRFLDGLCVNVKVAQLCLSLCYPMDYTVHGILQARILEWGAFPSPGDLPNPEIEPGSPALQADSLSYQGNLTKEINLKKIMRGVGHLEGSWA